ncbi:MAG: hypothetical protein IPK19_19675 [Chloroflexi bacterium]|nr:hypothetical protein [Chloroflexota bacterium]
MFDSLSLLGISLRGRLYQRAARWRFWAIVVVLLVVLLASVIALDLNDLVPGATVSSASDFTPSIQLLGWSGDDAGWQLIELPPGCCAFPSTFADSDGGIWLNDADLGLLPYRDDAWGEPLAPLREFDGVVGLPTISGDEAWITVDEDIAHFDGERWTREPNPLRDDYPVEMAASGETVVIVGYQTIGWKRGDSGWGTVRIAQALPDLVNEENFFYDEIYPTLKVSSDGAFWLSYYGIHRSEDGANWTSVMRLTGDAIYTTLLIGAEADGAWVADETGLAKIGADGETVQRFSRAEIGFGEDAFLAAAAMREGRGILSTYDKTYLYGGLSWREVPSQTDDLSYTSAVGVTGDGLIWRQIYTVPGALASSDAAGALAVYPLTSLLVRLATLIAGMAILIVPLADIGLRVLPQFMSDRQRWREQQRVLESLNFRAPGASRNPYALWRGAVAALSAAFWIVMATGGLTLLLGGLTAPDRGSTANPYADLETMPEDMSALDMINEAQVAKAASIVSSPLFGENIGALLGLFTVGGYLLARLMMRGLMSGGGSQQRILGWIMQGQYEEALKSIVVPGKDGEPVVTNPYLHAHTLMIAGRYTEAETAVRGLLGSATQLPPIFTSALFWILALIVRHRGEMDEAIHLHHASLLISPDHGVAYSLLGSTLMLAGADPALALAALVEGERLLVWNPGGRGFQAQLERVNQAEFAATKGWLLAVNGREQEVEPLLAEALRLTPETWTVAQASVHVFCGRARLALSDREAARMHFETAARLDPNGQEGMLAREMLREVES